MNDNDDNNNNNNTINSNELICFVFINLKSFLTTLT